MPYCVAYLVTLLRVWNKLKASDTGLIDMIMAHGCFWIKMMMIL